MTTIGPGAPSAVPACSVPRCLLGLGGLVALMALGLWVTMALAVHGARQGVQTIGQDAAPSIFAAQDIRARLLDLHAEAANDMLAGGLGSASARRAYVEDVQEIAGQLVAVAKNITYPAELAPILEIQKLFVTYTGLIEEGRTEIRHGNPIGVAFLRRADGLLHDKLLPATQQLATVNVQQLETAYRVRAVWFWIALLGVLCLGAALLAVLLYGQAYVRRQFHRLYNPALLGATALTLLLTLYTEWALFASHQHLRTAKQDAFDSVHALLELRAAANSANADESLWLLVRGAGQHYEQRFQEQTQRILEAAVTTELVATGWEALEGQKLRQQGKTATAHTLAARKTAAQAMARQRPLKGFLGMELANITSPGEGDSATEILVWYVHYMAIDALIRSLERDGKHWEAVALCVGTQDGQSNWVFQRFDDALSKTLTINRQGFETSVGKALGVLNGLAVLVPAVLLLVVASTVMGLWPRLAEFR